MIYDILLPVSPVPAARPKLARRGRRVYYPKTYADFRKQAKEVVPGAMMASGIGGPLKGPLLVALAIVAKRPKTTKLDYPSPDVDNYAKAVLDALNGWAFEDDTQVVALTVTKEWSQPSEEGHIEIQVQDGIETTRPHLVCGLR